METKIFQMDLKLWFETFSIHSRIQERIQQLSIVKISATSNDDIKETAIFDAYIMNSINPKYRIHLYNKGFRSPDDIPWELARIEQEIKSELIPVLIINGPRKKAYEKIWHQLPSQVIVITKYEQDSLIPPPPAGILKPYAYLQLKTLIDKVPNFPIQPKAIYGYGSFFRDKPQIGDIDIFIEYDNNQPRWVAFRQFFSRARDENPEKCVQTHHFYEEMRNLRAKFIQTSPTHRTPNVKSISKDPMFVEIIAKYGLDIDLIQECSWEDLLGIDANGYWKPPYIESLFKRMWKSSVRGISIMGMNEINDGKNYVLLWSPTSPDFETNYAAWDRIKDDYICKEYTHFLEDCQKWKEIYETEFQSLQSQDQGIHNMMQPLYTNLIQGIHQILNDYSPKINNDETYSELSRKCNEIRDRLKKLQTSFSEAKESLNMQSNNRNSFLPR